MLTFAIFPFVLFFLGAALVTGLPLAVTLQTYYKNRGRHAVRCPETGQPANVEMDHQFALQSMMHGQEQSRLQSCSRWPEKGECGQECLAQVDPTPENLERLFSTWFADSNCAICTRAITPSDWRQGRLAVVNDMRQLFELRDLSVEDLQETLESTHPLCWTCHQEERERQAVRPRAMRGDRTQLASLQDSV